MDPSWVIRLYDPKLGEVLHDLGPGCVGLKTSPTLPETNILAPVK